jgi:hypothetical protein
MVSAFASAVGVHRRARSMSSLLLYDAWHEWFFLRWRRGEGMWLGGYAIENHVLFGEYNGFGGDF